MARIILFIIISFSFLTGVWTENTVDHGESVTYRAESSQQKEKAAGEYTEFYYMRGIQISQRLCYLSTTCEPGEVIESDTLNTAFLVRLTFSSERPDSVLFDGLEGVNMPPREMIGGFNGGSAAYPECRSTSMGCGYARINGSKLKFDLSTPSGIYTGTGTLDDDGLSIQAHYVYRGAGAEYMLEGQKIVGVE